MHLEGPVFFFLFLAGVGGGDRGRGVIDYCIYNLAPVSLNVLSLFHASVSFFRLIWDHVLPQFISIIIMQ